MSLKKARNILANKGVSIPTSSNATVQAWLNKIGVDGYTYPSQSKVDIYTTAWDYADAQNLTSQFDLVGLLKVENQNLCKVPFIHSGGSGKIFDLVDSPIFTANNGLKGSGLQGYLDTKYSPTTDGINYTLNSACIGVFVSDNLAIDAPVIDSGNDNYGSNSLIFPRTTSNTLDGQINNDDFNRVSQSNLNSIGFFSVKRINASSVSVYKNGILQSSGAGTTAADSMPTYNVTILFSGVYTGNVSFLFAGNGAIDQAKLNTFVNLLLL